MFFKMEVILKNNHLNTETFDDQSTFNRHPLFRSSLHKFMLNLFQVSTNAPSPGILRKKELPPISSATSIKNPNKPNRKHTTGSQSSSGNGSSGSSTAGNGNGLYDSVELSFIEKLAKADTCHRKDLEDLKTFEMLEEAACDSSFCSSSSTVKRLIRVRVIYLML